MARRRMFDVGEVVTFPVRFARYDPPAEILGRIVGYNNSRYQAQAVARRVHGYRDPFLYRWSTQLPNFLRHPKPVRARDLRRMSREDVINVVRAQPNPNPAIMRNMRPTAVAKFLFDAANMYRTASSIPLQD
jgi:hypothetical protein